MARKLAAMSAELASWSSYYISRDQDRDGLPLYGPWSDRAVYLDDIVQRLDQVEQMLLNIPRTS